MLEQGAGMADGMHIKQVGRIQSDYSSPMSRLQEGQQEHLFLLAVVSDSGSLESSSKQREVGGWAGLSRAIYNLYYPVHRRNRSRLSVVGGGE